MQLILTHADLEAALINDLRSKGMTAFEPGKASVEFSFKRGTKELVCTLDTEAKAEVVADAPKPSTEIPSETTSAPVAPAPEAAPVEAAPVAEAPVEVPAADPVPELETAGGDDDNLFD